MGEIKKLFWFSGACFIIAAILLIVGMSTDEWLVGDNSSNIGLYRRCLNATCESFEGNGRIMTTIVMVIDGILAIAYLMTLLILYVLMVKKDKLDRYAKCFSYLFPQFILSSSFLSDIFILVGLILMGIEKNETEDIMNAKIGYSYELVIVAGIFIPIGGILAFLGRVPKPTKVEPVEVVVAGGDANGGTTAAATTAATTNSSPKHAANGQAHANNAMVVEAA